MPPPKPASNHAKPPSRSISSPLIFALVGLAVGVAVQTRHLSVTSLATHPLVQPVFRYWPPLGSVFGLSGPDACGTAAGRTSSLSCPPQPDALNVGHDWVGRA